MGRLRFALSVVCGLGLFLVSTGASCSPGGQVEDAAQDLFVIGSSPMTPTNSVAITTIGRGSIALSPIYLQFSTGVLRSSVIDDSKHPCTVASPDRTNGTGSIVIVDVLNSPIQGEYDLAVQDKNLNAGNFVTFLPIHPAEYNADGTHGALNCTMAFTLGDTVNGTDFTGLHVGPNSNPVSAAKFTYGIAVTTNVLSDKNKALKASFAMTFSTDRNGTQPESIPNFPPGDVEDFFDIGAFLAGPDGFTPLDNPKTTAVEALITPRSNHTATLMNNNDVLVCGGLGPTGGGTMLKTAEVFRSNKLDFIETTSSMSVARVGHTATLLNDGTVLVIGGRRDTSSPPLKSAEKYDPSTRTFATLPFSMDEPRWYHQATLMPNGFVFVSGGLTDAGCSSQTDTCEVYTGGSFVKLSTTMTVTRSSHGSTLLLVGPTGRQRILLSGGQMAFDPEDPPAPTEPLITGLHTKRCEIYDPGTGDGTTGFFVETGELTAGRWQHKAVLLTASRITGRVAVFGGYTSTCCTPPPSCPAGTNVSLVEVFDQTDDSGAGAWTTIDSAGDIPAPRTGFAAVLMPNGRQVMMCGGATLGISEYQIPTSGGWCAVPTSGGWVFDAEGAGQISPPATTIQTMAETTATDTTMTIPRGFHTATLIPAKGFVIVIGGGTTTGPIPCAVSRFGVCELYTPR